MSVSEVPPGRNAALDWLIRFFDRDDQEPVARRAPEPPEPRTQVSHDTSRIEVVHANGERERLTWNELAEVAVRAVVTPGEETAVSWIFRAADGEDLAVAPMGVRGEPELVTAMQERLEGFDNMAVVEALSAGASETFVVWQEEEDEPSSPGVRRS